MQTRKGLERFGLIVQSDVRVLHRHADIGVSGKLLSFFTPRHARMVRMLHGKILRQSIGFVDSIGQMQLDLTDPPFDFRRRNE